MAIMPAPKSISMYPSQWLDMINAVSVLGRSVTVAELGGKPLTKGRAAQLRFRFYRLRSLLRKDPMQQDMAAASEGVQCDVIRLEAKDGQEHWAAHFCRRDDNAEARALSAAIPKEPVTKE